MPYYELDDPDEIEAENFRVRGRKIESRKVPRKAVAPAATERPERERFHPSFNGSRHELAWVQTYLAPFYEDGLITDVLHTVKGGKEATVYCCRADPSTGVEWIAAKVYRPRMFRSLRNDSLYREGRDLVDEEGKSAKRDRRRFLAVRKRTRFGQQVLHDNWVVNEFSTLALLRRAGVHVPRPFGASENALLMAYVGAPNAPAPALHQVRLPLPEARRVWDGVVEDVERMLSQYRIHGDLSAYNILWWQGQWEIIDWPQAVDARANPHAFSLLVRDLERVADYFGPYGIDEDAQALARDMWRRHLPDSAPQNAPSHARIRIR